VKVVHFTKTLVTGGAELHLLTLCRGQVREGLDVTVACLMDDLAWGTRYLASDFRDAGVKVVRLGAAWLSSARAIQALRGLLRATKADVLHTHLPRADAIGAAAELGLAGTARVASVHDIYSRSQWRGKWLLPVVRQAWRHADGVIAISSTVKEWLVRRARIPERLVHVVHYGIELDRFKDAEGPARPQREGPWVIGSIGRLEPRKGHECLIRAVALLRGRLGPLELKVAGNDPWGYGRTLRELAAGLGVGDCVKLVGFQSDVLAFLRSLDLFAFASRSEGFGQVVVEAMACGVPIVASAVPPISEIVRSGETGILAPPESPAEFAKEIAGLLLAPERAARMVERAREHVRKRFSASRMTADTIWLYERLRRG
jgi:glycosyltransferase involved in cell wall biosynthesis